MLKRNFDVIETGNKCVTISLQLNDGPTLCTSQQRVICQNNQNRTSSNRGKSLNYQNFKNAGFI